MIDYIALTHNLAVALAESQHDNCFAVIAAWEDTPQPPPRYPIFAYEDRSYYVDLALVAVQIVSEEVEKNYKDEIATLRADLKELREYESEGGRIDDDWDRGLYDD